MELSHVSHVFHWCLCLVKLVVFKICSVPDMHLSGKGLSKPRQTVIFFSCMAYWSFFVRLDQELDFIMAQQQELEDMLKPLEDAVKTGTSGSRLLQQSDKERDIT